MKNSAVVLLSALCLSVMTACGNVSLQETRGEPALQDPQTKAFYCDICPVAPGQVQEMSRKPELDTVTGMYVCWPCDGNPYCGDGLCEYPENSTNCPSDCGTPYCGDGVCNGSESCSTCSSDCGTCAPVCGDGVCSSGESCSTCSSDCGTCGSYCGDGICEYPETRLNCRIDCMYACYQEPCP